MTARAYATLPGPNGPWQLHYREGGRGYPLVLLHPSPLSSAFLEPTLRRVADRCHCFALDTPGFGQSDPLPEAWQESDLAPYVRALLAFLDALDLHRPLLYGSATGAQIAMAFAAAHPRRCAGLLLENVATFSRAEHDAIVAKYFPTVTPRRDGEHLQQLWTIAARSARYFPWFDDDGDQRGEDPPPVVAEAIMRGYLQAGTGYERAYCAAFAHEREEAITALRVPTRIVQWADCILGEYATRLEALALPDGVALRHADHGMDARLTAVAAAADELIQGLD